MIFRGLKKFFGMNAVEIKHQKIEEILGFWFNGIDSPDQIDGVLTPYWFCATPSLNQEISMRFLLDINASGSVLSLLLDSGHDVACV